jgi:hypothetical protein
MPGARDLERFTQKQRNRRGADFGYCELGGYEETRAKATGFFRVEQIDGVWWFVDPHGHLYLSTGVNGEFHIGVPENGLGAGLVQAMNPTERGIGYRYYVEQGLSLPYAVGTHWFQWTDEPITGRLHGENYSIGFIDAAGRIYPELVEAAKATHKCLHDVHAGKVPPFSQRPKASAVGTPSSPWDV